MRLTKRGQLAGIEFQYFIVGFIIGLIGGLALVALGTKKILPFKIPMVCGFLFPGFQRNKKGQLAILEFKFAIIGFFLGLIIALVLVYLGTIEILPFKIPFVC
jgi:uncharacterized membrane protein